MVTTGLTEGDNISIVQGLSEGDSVVIDGADKLHEGSLVESYCRPRMEKLTMPGPIIKILRPPQPPRPPATARPIMATDKDIIGKSHEPFPHFYHAPGGHVASHGRHPARGRRGV